MVVVDTNVLFALLIHGNRSALAQELYERDSDWRSEAFVLVEFSNVLATCIRTGRLDRRRAKDLLSTAEQALTALVQLPHARVLEVALDLGITAYDARFVAAAQTLNAKVVSEDARLRQAAPAYVQCLPEAIASYG